MCEQLEHFEQPGRDRLARHSISLTTSPASEIRLVPKYRKQATSNRGWRRSMGQPDLKGMLGLEVYPLPASVRELRTTTDNGATSQLSEGLSPAPGNDSDPDHVGKLVAELPRPAAEPHGHELSQFHHQNNSQITPCSPDRRVQSDDNCEKREGHAPCPWWEWRRVLDGEEAGCYVQ